MASEEIKSSELNVIQLPVSEEFDSLTPYGMPIVQLYEILLDIGVCASTSSTYIIFLILI